VLCLHFNAEGWGDPNAPTLIDTKSSSSARHGSYLKDDSNSTMNVFENERDF